MTRWTQLVRVNRAKTLILSASAVCRQRFWFRALHTTFPFRARKISIFGLLAVSCFKCSQGTILLKKTAKLQFSIVFSKHLAPQATTSSTSRPCWATTTSFQWWRTFLSGRPLTSPTSSSPATRIKRRNKLPVTCWKTYCRWSLPKEAPSRSIWSTNCSKILTKEQSLPKCVKQ